MEYGNEKYTDEELAEALKIANGQPTKASEILGVDYSGVYRRIRKNPELLEVQKAYRAKVFNDVSNTMVFIAMAGIIKEPVTDEHGEVIKGVFKEVVVDYRTRLSAMQNILNTFKSDEGIKEEIVIENKNSIDYSKLSDSALQEILSAENNN